MLQWYERSDDLGGVLAVDDETATVAVRLRVWGKRIRRLRVRPRLPVRHFQCEQIFAVRALLQVGDADEPADGRLVERFQPVA